MNNPGFQLLSLSNSRGDLASAPVFSTSPCMLPNQLHIFITYGIAFILTLIVVIIDNWRRLAGKDSLLPSVRTREGEDSSTGRWKKNSSGKNVRFRNLVSGCLLDLRRLGVRGLVWYLWLIWY